MNQQRPYHSVGVSVEDQQVGDGLTEMAMVSFFGVAEYNYKGRYYVKGSIRTDGSSKFGRQTLGYFLGCQRFVEYSQRRFHAGYQIGT